MVGGTKAALALNGLGRADGEEQGFMDETAEVWAAVSLLVTSAARLSFGCIQAALTPHTQLLTTALIILSAGHIYCFARQTPRDARVRKAITSLHTVSIADAAMLNIVPQVTRVDRCGNVVSLRFYRGMDIFIINNFIRSSFIVTTWKEVIGMRETDTLVGPFVKRILGLLLRILWQLLHFYNAVQLRSSCRGVILKDVDEV